jgi:hypothetical protein
MITVWGMVITPVALERLLRLVQHHRHVEVVPRVEERDHPVRLLGRDGHELDRRTLLADLAEVGHRGDAWHAPRCPELENDHFALQRGEGDLGCQLACFDASQLDVGGHVARLELGVCARDRRRRNGSALIAIALPYLLSQFAGVGFRELFVLDQLRLILRE